ncbi:LacI family DNA-binding transcriptional regulator [Azospirillum soli]|uniref:LacI family DNA-binding transcriptional regulator n=1 Tax=Azospirillum soli TaxID=1304799 RepID=UPI001AE1AD89|nr:LacI family DNA-binding transcriptional regulator [Azospirillum soli]MBP2312886.1 LacI family gluconate utilization system Gnt-I transcriptional repressor [Azospirillum soli]
MALLPSKTPRKRSRRATQRLTMTDVASAAGVSPSTVSLYLRRPEAVSAELATRVRAVIDELGYVPNLVAGSLAAAKSRTIGVILPSITNSFYAETYNTLQQAFQAAHYQTLLGVSEFDPEREEELIRAMLAWSPAAMVVTGLHHTDRTRAMLGSCGVPVVETWDIPSPQCPAVDMSVGFSHFEVGRRQTSHLYDQGSRKVAYIGAAVHQDMRVRSRTDGYEDEVKRRGLHEPIAFTAPDTASTPVGIWLIDEVLTTHPDIDGVVCSNDALALGVLFEANRKGLRVPDDLAVVGFGDLTFSASCIPPLTTVRPPQREIGELAAGLILARLNDDKAPAIQRNLECELVVRDSTRASSS